MLDWPIKKLNVPIYLRLLLLKVYQMGKKGSLFQEPQAPF